MKRIVILAVVLVIVLGGWSAAWLYAANLVRANVVELADADGQTEPRAVCGGLDIGGYPLYFDVTCTNLTVTSGDITATLPQIKASVQVIDPWHAVAFVTGPLDVEDAFSGSRHRLAWKSLEASARLTGWRIARVSIVGDELALADTVGGEVPLARAAHAEFHLLDMPALHDAQKGLAGLHLYSLAEHVSAPGFEIADGKSTLEAEISGLSDDVRTYGDPDALRRWQAAGGKVKLVGLKGEDAGENFTVTGDLGLDAQARPQGQLAVASKGLVERFGTLVPEQWRGVVLGGPDKDGAYHQVLTLSNGVLLSGIIPLAALPPLL